MKVAFLNHVGDAMGGAEQTLLTVLKHRPTGLDAEVIVFEDGAFANKLRALGVLVHVIRVPKSLNALNRDRFRLSVLLPLPAVILRVARILRRGRFDLLYTNSMKAHLVGSVAGRFTGTPCIMHLHDHIVGWGLMLLRMAARFGSVHRIACSKDVARRNGVGKTTVIFSPIDLKTFGHLPGKREAREALGLEVSLPTVSLIGRINRWKGHDRFLRIAKRVSRDIPSQFVIVGSPMFRDQDFLPELEEMVSREDLRNTVRFVPWVEDVREVYAATDVLANCSTREPLGRTPAEAAASGVPSVVFDDSGAAEWMLDGIDGRIVPAGDETAMAEAIKDLLIRNCSSSARIRQSAERFEPGRVTDDIMKVIATFSKHRHSNL